MNQEQEVGMVNAVNQDPRVNTVCPDEMVTMARMDHEEIPDQEDVKETLDSLDVPDLKDRQEWMADPVTEGHLVPREQTDDLETTALSLDCRARRENQVTTEWTVWTASLVTMAMSAHLEFLENVEAQEKRVNQVCQVWTAALDHKVLVETPVPKDVKDLSD